MIQMATANFKHPNTKRHYAIGLDGEDEFYYDDSIANVQAELGTIKAKDIDSGKVEKWLAREEKAIYEFTLQVFDKYYKEWTSANLYITISSGYYQGAIFDIDKSEFDELDLSKSTLERIDRLWNRAEKVLENNTTALVRVATFSNGEAIYEKASNKRSILKAIATGNL